MDLQEWNKGEFTVSTDKQRLDLDTIHGFLTESYWAKGIEKDRVRIALEHSVCFGLYHGPRQIGFARVVTDLCNLAYLADVFVLEAYRGRGLGQWLVQCVVSHPDLQVVRRFLLVTRDAHGVYEKLGFGPLEEPTRYMTLKRKPLEFCSKEGG